MEKGYTLVLLPFERQTNRTCCHLPSLLLALTGYICFNIYDCTRFRNQKKWWSKQFFLFPQDLVFALWLRINANGFRVCIPTFKVPQSHRRAHDAKAALRNVCTRPTISAHPPPHLVFTCFQCPQLSHRTISLDRSGDFPSFAWLWCSYSSAAPAVLNRGKV